MPSTSPTSSRSMVSVPQINVVHDIVVEDLADKWESREEEDLYSLRDGEFIFAEGEFSIKIKPDESDKGKYWARNKNGRDQELVLGWGISHQDQGGPPGAGGWRIPALGIIFGLRNLSNNKYGLPITAKIHVMKNGKKMKLLCLSMCARLT